MKDFNFPLYNSKRGGDKFALNDPVEREKYFKLKVGAEIEKIRDYLQNNSFVGFLLGKKNSGKGTYSKLFSEAVGPERIAHISVGDIVRDASQAIKDEALKKELLNHLEKNYRGFMPLEEALNALLGRSTSNLLPTELILTLVEREILKVRGKALFIDGFPRNLDQVSYSLYFRHLMGYRDDPDFFVFIDVPEAIIDERMKYRVVCPVCRTPRNLKVLRTKEIGYSESKKEFFLICDNQSCGKSRMVPKEGDELGIEAIRDRIEIDNAVMKTLLGLNGVPKILLRNSVPADSARETVDDYEITPAYRYEWDNQGKKVRVIEEPWAVRDEEGVLVNSLLPEAVVVSLISQVAKTLSS